MTKLIRRVNRIVDAFENEEEQTSEVLPQGLAESLKLLQSVQHEADHVPGVDHTRDRAEREANKARQRETHARLKQVKAHVFKLQQGPAAPVIDAHSMARVSIARSNACQNRLARLAALAKKNPKVADLLTKNS